MTSETLESTTTTVEQEAAAIDDDIVTPETLEPVTVAEESSSSVTDATAIEGDEDVDDDDALAPRGDVNDDDDNESDGNELDTDFLDFLYFAPPPEQQAAASAEDAPANNVDDDQWMKELDGDGDDDSDVSSAPVEEIWSGILEGMSDTKIQGDDASSDDENYADFIDCLDEEEDGVVAGDDGNNEEAQFAAFLQFFSSPEGQAIFLPNGSDNNDNDVSAEEIWSQIVSGMAEERPPWYTPLWTRIGLYSPESHKMEEGGRKCQLDNRTSSEEEEISPWLDCFRAWFAVNNVVTAKEQADEESKECDLEDGLYPVTTV